MRKEVKLNPSGIKYTPSTFITYYEVNTNFVVNNKEELLKLDEVRAVLNSHTPEIRGDANRWSIAVYTPLHEIGRLAL